MKAQWRDRKTKTTHAVHVVATKRISGLKRYVVHPEGQPANQFTVLASDCKPVVGEGLTLEVRDRMRKIKALVDRGATEHERAAAERRLESLAQSVGLTLAQVDYIL